MIFFQAPYNWFKYWTAPRWLKDLLQQLNDLMFEILQGVGQAYIQYMQANIIEAAGHTEWTDKQKLDFIYQKAKTGFFEFGVKLRDDEISILINYLTSLLKKQGVIK